MAELNWPLNPTIGQEYTSPNGDTWIWNGYAWDAVGETIIGPTGPTGISGNDGAVSSRWTLQNTAGTPSPGITEFIIDDEDWASTTTLRVQSNSLQGNFSGFLTYASNQKSSGNQVIIQITNVNDPTNYAIFDIFSIAFEFGSVYAFVIDSVFSSNGSPVVDEDYSISFAVGASSASTDTNFANTDLTFDASRSHDITPTKFLQITSDAGNFEEAYFFLAGSTAGPGRVNPIASLGYDVNYISFDPDFSTLIGTSVFIASTDLLSISGDNVIVTGSGTNGDIVTGNNSVSSISSNANRDTRPVIVSSKNSTILDGVDNSVILGGSTITAEQSNSAYLSHPVVISDTAPSETDDTSGTQGEIRYDTNYLYIKTSVGWKRVELSTFTAPL